MSAAARSGCIARVAPALLLIALHFSRLTAAADQSQFATHGMVASVHPLATEAGLNILKSGGNAIDAAVAVGFTLGVVDADNSGIGGGCFMLIRLANGRFVAIDGRETAPAAATRDLFVRNGKVVAELSLSGALASGVPGEVAAFEYALSRFGRKSLRDVLLPAAEIAENGFEISAEYAARLKGEADDMAKFESSRAVFFKDGRPLQKGEVLKQPELAAMYRGIAGQGSDWFYRGPFARATAKWMQANGGLLTLADFAGYRIKLRDPVTTTYRGFKIVSFGPPSSGGVHVAQMLNMLERFALKELDEAMRLHVLAEAMKLAFADRAHWLGDPDFTRVPRGLVSKRYAATLAKRINLDRATAVPAHGEPPRWQRDFFQTAAVSSGSNHDPVAGNLPLPLGGGEGWGEGGSRWPQPPWPHWISTQAIPMDRSADLPIGSTMAEKRTELIGKLALRRLGGSTRPLTLTLSPSEGERESLGVVAIGTGDTAVCEAFDSKKHTTHWSVADAEGNWVACTATVNTSFGSKVVIPGTGVVLNNQMDDFSAQPGVANYFGLVGAEANAVAPGKRPLSSMSPTIVLKDGKPIIALGAAGGPKIITAVVLELVAMLDLGFTPEQALAAPRIHNQWSPNELMVERALPGELKVALEQRGHAVKELKSFATSQIVARSADGKGFVGAADPRAGGNAVGW